MTGSRHWAMLAVLAICNAGLAAAEDRVNLPGLLSEEDAPTILPQDSPPAPPKDEAYEGAEPPAPVPETPIAPSSDFCCPAVYVSPYAGDLWERPVLLGDFKGGRSELADAGYTIDVSNTQFYQGVASGGVRRDFDYGGRFDYYLNVDGKKAGLHEGFFITLHAETRYGEAINAETGAIMPANFPLLFPIPGQTVTALTGVKFMQAFSENFLAFAGKINTLDEFRQPFNPRRYTDSFTNMALAFPVPASRTVPYSTLGAGFAVLRDMQPIFSTMILDTNNTPTTSGFDSFFNNGMTIVSRLDIPVTFNNLPGHQGFWGTYSSGTYSDLSPTSYYDPILGTVTTTGRQTGSWSLFYSADQAFYVDPQNPKRSYGIFTNLGLADNGPSPVRWSANVGVNGAVPFDSRPLDTFGVGYAYTGYSQPVHDFLANRNDQVVELFYNIAVTPWFRLTPDLQILVPAREQTISGDPINTDIVLGVRGKIDF